MSVGQREGLLIDNVRPLLPLQNLERPSSQVLRTFGESMIATPFLPRAQDFSVSP